MRNEKESTLEEKCVYHWLNCLYADFLMKRKAGEQIPCNSCSELKNCNSCPPINFNIAGEKIGLSVEYRTSKVR